LNIFELIIISGTAVLGAYVGSRLAGDAGAFVGMIAGPGLVFFVSWVTWHRRIVKPVAFSGHPEETNLEPEDALSSEDELRAARLSAKDLARIDASLLSHARPQWRKLAMIVSLAMDDCGEDISNIPDVFYSRRAAQLASEGKLVTFGDVRRMRHCEVRLPESLHT